MVPDTAILKLSEPDSEFQKILESSGLPPLLPSDIIALRELTNGTKDKARELLGGPPVGVTEYDIEIPVRDGTKIPARVFAPVEVEGGEHNSPLFAFFHGGGYCIGSFQDENVTNRALALEAGITVVSVEYRLAPEHAFPTCVYDAWDSVKWISANASLLNADPRAGLIVGGVSSGGNIANAVVYLNRDEGSPVNITGQFLSVANLLPPPVVPERYKENYISVEQNKHVAVPSPDLVQLFMSAYKPDITSPPFVPFNHPQGAFSIPPTYLQVCGLDTLRDEELIYERILREDYSIPTRLDVYSGLPHHFWEFFPQLVRQTEKRKADTVDGLKWLLDVGGGK